MELDIEWADGRAFSWGQTISHINAGQWNYTILWLLWIWNLLMLTSEYCFGVVHFVCHSSLYYFCLLLFCILASPSPRVNKFQWPTFVFVTWRTLHISNLITKQVQIEKKGKQIKVVRRYFIEWKLFFIYISCKRCFFVNWSGAHN